MKKKLAAVLLTGTLGIILAGCSNTKVSTSKTTYQPDGMTAVVKGKTDNQNHLTYQINHGKKQHVSVNDREFVFQVPAADHDQKVTITAENGGKKSSATVTVKSKKPLAKYQDVQQKFNQVIVMSQIPKQDLQVLQQAQKVNLHDPTQLMKNQALLKQAQQAQTKMKQVKSQTVNQQIKATATGLTNLIDNDAFTLRANIQDGQLMGGTFIIPTATFKHKEQAKQFGMTFMAFNQAIGADGKQVMKDFRKETKSQNKSQTTSKTIKNNGITYSVGFSKTDLYIYITR